MIAALYVIENGPYYGIPDVDPWPESRDARTYAGPWPVVAHPPCARWGRYWDGGPAARGRFRLGDDGGCFAAALASVKTWGGVLEHPAGSRAWDHFGLARPPASGGWVPTGLFVNGWTCHVEQGNYGHRANKATWLYAVGVDLPELRWGYGGCKVKYSGNETLSERRRLLKTGICQRLSKRQRMETPEPFRDLLLSIARTANIREATA